jgi:hypothetical protein
VPAEQVAEQGTRPRVADGANVRSEHPLSTQSGRSLGPF